MYVKLFRSLWQGTLCGRAHAQLVFIYLLAHADAEGNVDIHPRKIALDCGLTEEEVRAAAATLEGPDPESRSQTLSGARIERIDEHRPWGWRIVNFLHYRTLRDSEMLREQTRERVRRHRETKRAVTHGNASKRQEEEDADAEEEESPPLLLPPGSRKRAPAPKPLDLGEGEVVEELPTVSLGEAVRVRASQAAEWTRLFPACDVPQELRSMRAWLDANAPERKTARGMKRFCAGWLMRQQNRGGSVRVARARAGPVGSRAAVDASYAETNPALFEGRKTGGTNA